MPSKHLEPHQAAHVFERLLTGTPPPCCWRCLGSHSVCVYTPAIQYIHDRAVVHLDIKPQNIMVCTRGEEVVPVLVDFGLATTVLRGSPPFESPEVADLTGCGLAWQGIFA
jgi:serine/threonine protein kinase